MSLSDWIKETPPQEVAQVKDRWGASARLLEARICGLESDANALEKENIRLKEAVSALESRAAHRALAERVQTLTEELQNYVQAERNLVARAEAAEAEVARLREKLVHADGGYMIRVSSSAAIERDALREQSMDLQIQVSDLLVKNKALRAKLEKVRAACWATSQDSVYTLEERVLEILDGEGSDDE